MTNKLTRRRFIQGTGSLAVAFTFGSGLIASGAKAITGAGASSGLSVREEDEDFAYLCIGPDNRVTIFSGKVELGTGIQTALTQIIIEELPVGVDAVDYVQGDTRAAPDGGYTAGSNSIRTAGPAMRLAAATARKVLLDLAEGEFGVARKALRLHDGLVSVGKSKRHARSYAELIGNRELALVSDETAPTVDPKKHEVVGTSMPRVELPDKLLATFRYVQDVVLPGMLHGRVVRPAGRNSQLSSYDATAAQAVPGFVDVVQIDNFIGVVAETEWAAISAARALEVEWSRGAGLIPQADLPSALKDPANHYFEDVEVDVGNVDDALADAAGTLDAEYFTPFQMHGAFAPSCAVADVHAIPDANGVVATVWSGTQGVYPLRGAVAELLGLGDEEVHVIYFETAGCYGHIGVDDAAGDAALLSQAVGAPVRVQWSRQDEHGWEPLGPAMCHSMRGGVDDKGRLVAWEHTAYTPTHVSRPGNNGGNLLAGQSVGLLPSPLLLRTRNLGGRNGPVSYAFPNRRYIGKAVRSFLAEGPDGNKPVSPLTWLLPRSTALRSLGGVSNSFANESFFDELARLAGKDPVKLRLENLEDPRARAVVKAVAKAAKWKKKKKKKKDEVESNLVTGRGFGYQQYELDDSHAAAVIDVEVDLDTGIVRVLRAVVAHDCGQIINPDGLRAQIEGNVIQGVSRALVEEVLYLGDAVKSTLWQENPFFPGPLAYPVVRFDAVPEIETVLIDRPEEPPTGAGEPTIGVIPGAIGNAVCDATGVRIRTLPMTPDRVLAALGGG